MVMWLPFTHCIISEDWAVSRNPDQLDIFVIGVDGAFGLTGGTPMFHGGIRTGGDVFQVDLSLYSKKLIEGF